MKKYLWIILLVVVTQGAFGQTDRWYYVSSDKETDVYVDNETIRKNGNIYIFWRQDVCPKLKAQIKIQNDKPSVFMYDEVKIKEAFDSKNYRTKYISAIYYNKNEVVYNIPDFEMDWKDIIPGSIGEDVIKAILLLGTSY